MTDDQALAAMAAAFRYLKIVLEPGGAAALAAALAHGDLFKGRNVAVICTGANVDPDIFSRAISA